MPDHAWWNLAVLILVARGSVERWGTDWVTARAFHDRGEHALVLSASTRAALDRVAETGWILRLPGRTTVLLTEFGLQVLARELPPVLLAALGTVEYISEGPR